MRKLKPALCSQGSLRGWMLALLVVLASMNTSHADEIRRVESTVPMADWQSAAELTLPATSNGPVPGVLLIHGATPADMDFTLPKLGGGIRSHILKDIAEHLSANGYAVLRYNKRYVSGPMQVEMEKYARLTLTELVDDAAAALDVLAAHPGVDADRLFVFGWSEGSLVGTALAERRDLAGLILQGPVAEPIQAVFRSQWTEVTIPFVQDYTGDAKLTGHDIKRVFQSSAGMLVKGYVGIAMDPAHGMANPRINRKLDQDGDNQVDLETEVMPLVLANMAAYGAEGGLPHLLDQRQALQGQPVLLLHGEHDANVPPRNADALKAMLGDGATLKRYPDLGHSLGKAATLAEDDFLPIEQQPLEDMVSWLDAVTGDRHAAR
ncbi:MAG: alpha/beta fold hydrolase [Gammaproteobacteria bacterium]|nr:alpha/beta fold hydrolase [Gammaproteobacteria bacterium]